MKWDSSFSISKLEGLKDGASVVIRPGLRQFVTVQVREIAIRLENSGNRSLLQGTLLNAG